MFSIPGKIIEILNDLHSYSTIDYSNTFKFYTSVVGAESPPCSIVDLLEEQQHL